MTRKLYHNIRFQCRFFQTDGSCKIGELLCVRHKTVPCADFKPVQLIKPAYKQEQQIEEQKEPSWFDLERAKFSKHHYKDSRGVRF